MTLLIDSHCHLDFPDFDKRHDEIMQNAADNGVGAAITISTRVHKLEGLKAICEAHDDVYFTVGTHPHNADEERGLSAQTLIELSSHEKCVGIGEAGLDYFYEKASAVAQREGFLTHIEAAQKTGLPLVIHSRDAEVDTIDILNGCLAVAPFKPLLHCFTASMDMAKKALDLGAYISFSGIVTFKNSQELRDVAAMVPADRYIVETDAPYLAPVPFRGKKNQPAYVRHTAEHVAAARGISFEQVCEETTANVFTLFDKLPETQMRTRFAQLTR